MQQAGLRTARVLIVDDQEPNVRLLTTLPRRADYTALERLTDSRLVLESFLAFEPDIVLLDLHMPFLDGLGVLEQPRPRTPPDTFLPTVRRLAT